MKILILGGARFHGYKIAVELSKNHDVYVLNRGNYRKEYPEKINHLVGDRNDKAVLKSLLSELHFDIVIDNNAYNDTQIELLLDILRPTFSQYILVSSVAVYTKLFSNDAISEDEPLVQNMEGYSPNIQDYALNKFKAENLLKKRTNQYTILRYPNIFGKEDFAHKLGYFYNRFVNQETLLLEEEINKFSLICIDDVVQSILMIVANKKFILQTVNIADSQTFTYEEFFQNIYGEIYNKKYIKTVVSKDLWEKGFLLPFGWGPIVSNKQFLSFLPAFTFTPFSKWAREAFLWEKEFYDQKRYDNEHKLLEKKILNEFNH